MNITTISQPEGKEKIFKRVAILGGAAWKETDEIYIQAFDTAKLLAENGYEIFNGGGPGVMKAATKGAHAGGGQAFAITYRPNKPKRHYEGTDPTNDAEVEIVTLDYFDRTKVLLQNTDVHIVFKGSIGTLSEFGMSWINSWIHEPNSKPIIMFGIFWNEILDIIQKNLLIKPAERQMLKICTTPEEVLGYLNSLNS
ncbi:MAG: hypothetical protein KatS3mg101_0578 [Patescibacteria group bacterium]|nr:MAG: hypothetical protein KatS3mg101_0578 [Patescibacteria group bacterium]